MESRFDAHLQPPLYTVDPKFRRRVELFHQRDRLARARDLIRPETNLAALLGGRAGLVEAARVMEEEIARIDAILEAPEIFSTEDPAPIVRWSARSGVRL